MKVLKFGGSSVANSENIKKVLTIVSDASNETKIAVVVSAFGKTTDNLLAGANHALQNIELAKQQLEIIQKLHFEVINELIKTNITEVSEKVSSLFNKVLSIYQGVFLLQELSAKTLAKVSSFGEKLSSFIIANAAKELFDATHQESNKLIITDSNYLNAQVDFGKTNQNIIDFFNTNPHQVTIFGGFISSNEGEEITTLGRGGSDYSAAIFAAALDADVLEIWTDVSGMFTANPTIVKQAFAIKEISYEEAMELSHFGAKVLYPPTIQPALRKEIPIRIKNTFDPENSGTLISNNPQKTEQLKEFHTLKTSV